jgi:hypothetical protein
MRRRKRAMTRNVLHRRLLAAFFCLSIGTVAAASDDDICSQIARFHRSSFDHTEQPIGRHWVELHWVGHWLDFDSGFSLKCKSSTDTAARELCGWLTTHTSIEFPATLPQRILTCYGHRFPRGSQWGGWKSEISLFPAGRELLLEVDLLTMRKEAGAIRLSSFVDGKDDALVEMPPMTELGGNASRPSTD